MSDAAQGRAKRPYVRRTPVEGARIAEDEPMTMARPILMEAKLAEQAGPSEMLDPTPPRPAMRPAMREDPRERAKRRAAEIRDQGGFDAEGVDKYAVASADIPDGWTYEWKRRATMGQEDPAYMVNLQRTGWEPVPHDRHPHMMPPNWTGGTIERDGMVLMERPASITQEVATRDKRRAAEQIRMKRAQLGETPAGTMDRTRASLKTNYEPMPIPEDASAE